MSDALLILLATNLAAAVAVALVMALRLPARKLFGPRIAYGLWLLVPLAAVGMLLPARIETVTVRATQPDGAALPATLAADVLPAAAAAPFDPWPLAMGLWVAGVLLTVVWMAWRQAQFGRDAEAGLAGPAAVGLLTPRVVTPSDFTRRYSPREQFIVLAHERTHIVRQDTRINALVTAALCVNWFNPALYVLAHVLRLDQELACDAQVIARHPKVRRSYAEAMLKTQLAARPLPVGCYWLPAHPLTERVRMLSRAAPAPHEQVLGLGLLTALTFAVMGSAWAVKPARVQFIETPTVALQAPPVLTRIGPTEAQPLAPMSNRPAEPAAPRAPAPPAPVSPDSVLAQAVTDTQVTPALREGDRLRWAYEGNAEPKPPRRIYALARRSSVEPGSAVRVVASTTDAEGRPLMVDLTSFGSQHFYRTGTFIASGSRERLFTSVMQRGERLWVTASLSRRFEDHETATVELRSGETGQLTLPNGRLVTVTPTLRPETAEEAAGDHAALSRVNADIGRASKDAWAAYRQQCRAGSC